MQILDVRWIKSCIFNNEKRAVHRTCTFLMSVGSNHAYQWIAGPVDYYLHSQINMVSITGLSSSTTVWKYAYHDLCNWAADDLLPVLCVPNRTQAAMVR